MKTKISVMLLCTVLFVGLQLSCNDDGVLKDEPKAAGENPLPEDLKKGESNNGRVGTCNQSFTGNWGGVGYYPYPDRTIDLSQVAVGCVVSVTFDCKEVPNAFNIYDASGLDVASSGWLGTANYPGAFGSPPFNAQLVKTVVFTKGTSNIYTLRVRTHTPPPPFPPRVDVWSVNMSCNCPIVPPPTCTDGIKNGNETGVDCGGTCAPCCVTQIFSGSQAGTGGYFYPATQEIIVNHIPNGGIVSVHVDAALIPNRFTIKDQDLNTVANSEWMGRADYHGYHGSFEIDKPTQQVLTFPKVAGRIYKLHVETSRPTQPTAIYPNPPYSDTWSASKGCPQ